MSHLYSPQKWSMEIGSHKWPLISHCNPDGEALRVTIEAFGVTSGYQFHWSRLTIQIPLFSFLTTCEGPNCSSWMQPFDLTSFFVDFSYFDVAISCHCHFMSFFLWIFTILEEHFGPSQVVGNEKDGICIVLSRDQWKLVTFEDYTNGTFGFLLSFGVFPCRKKEY